MENYKQNIVINSIVFKITHGEMSSGDVIFHKEYNASRQTMTAVFKTLTDENIAKRQINNHYVLTEYCKENAQELYFKKIGETVAYLKSLADTANIDYDLIIDVVASELMSRTGEQI